MVVPMQPEIPATASVSPVIHLSSSALRLRLPDHDGRSGRGHVFWIPFRRTLHTATGLRNTAVTGERATRPRVPGLTTVARARFSGPRGFWYQPDQPWVSRRGWISAAWLDLS